MATTWDNDAMDELARGVGITGAVVDAAEVIAEQIRSDAPVDTEEYRNSISVTVKQQRRSVALVQSSDPKALILESILGIMARATKKSARRR